MVDKVLKVVEKIQNENLELRLDGFIQGKFQIKEAKAFIEKEILTIQDSESGYFIRIIDNQIYNVEIGEKDVEIYLDNDIKLVISLIKK